MAKFKRILLKLSGESLMGEKKYGIDEKRLGEYAQQIKEIHDMGVQIGIVIGGGNIFRGLSGAGKGFDRVKGDQMGMLATVINSLALSSALVAAGVKARVLTAVRMEPIGEFYSKWKAIECMENGDPAAHSRRRKCIAVPHYRPFVSDWQRKNTNRGSKCPPKSTKCRLSFLPVSVTLIAISIFGAASTALRRLDTRIFLRLSGCSFRIFYHLLRQTVQ